MNPTILAKALLGQSQDDWYKPRDEAYPFTTDPRADPMPDFRGSEYSPRRNMWRSPNGETVEAGAFRPLPPDVNTVDPQYLFDQYFRGPSRLWNP